MSAEPVVVRQRPWLARETPKYIAIFRAELRQLLAYTWDFLLSNITILLFFYVLIQVWQVTVTPGKVAGLPGESFNWATLIWFLAGTQTLYFAVQSDAQLDIEDDVISGNIAVTLARPYDYLLARFARTFANVLLSFLVAFPAAFLLAWIMSGEIAVSIGGIVAFFAAFLLRTLLYFALQAIAGLATFWIEKATAFVWILGFLIITFGGGVVPLGFWPSWARTAAELSPFPAMMYYPARLLVAPTSEHMMQMLVRSAVWLVILGTIVGLIYHRALRRLDINGG